VHRRQCGHRSGPRRGRHRRRGQPPGPCGRSGRDPDNPAALRGRHLAPGVPRSRDAGTDEAIRPRPDPRQFGKTATDGEGRDSGGTATAGDTTLDPEAVLVRAGALEGCRESADLCFTGDFRTAWYDAIDRVETEDAGRERLLDVLDVEEAVVRFQDHGEAFSADVADRTVGTWESRAAFLADLGAAEVLADRRGGWAVLSVASRSQLLNGLWLFIDECPGCGGTPGFGTETVEYCCSAHEVAALECEDCGARLFDSAPT